MLTRATITGSLLMPPTPPIAGQPLRQHTVTILHKLALLYAAEERPDATNVELVATEVLITLSLLEPRSRHLGALSDRLALHPGPIQQALVHLATEQYLRVQRAQIVLTEKGLKRAEADRTVLHSLIHNLPTMPQETVQELHRMSLSTIAAKQADRRINPSQMCIVCSYFKPFAHVQPAAPHQCELTAQAFSGPPALIRPRPAAGPRKPSRQSA